MAKKKKKNAKKLVLGVLVAYVAICLLYTSDAADD